MRAFQRDCAADVVFLRTLRIDRLSVRQKHSLHNPGAQLRDCLAICAHGLEVSAEDKVRVGKRDGLQLLYMAADGVQIIQGGHCFKGHFTLLKLPNPISHREL